MTVVETVQGPSHPGNGPAALVEGLIGAFVSRSEFGRSGTPEVCALRSRRVWSSRIPLSLAGRAIAERFPRLL